MHWGTPTNGMQGSQLGVLLADAQAKSSAAAGTANGTGSKAKAGKVVFGATGNRLLDKQQADKAAKPPAPKPEVLSAFTSLLLNTARLLCASALLAMP